MAPAMGTNEQTMAWMVDAYSTHAGRLVPGIVTGKPIGLQGSAGRTRATGRGVAFLACRALNKLGIPLSSATAVIRGFGKVGSHAACDLSNSGVKITGISDVSGAIWNGGGIDTMLEAAFARVLAFAERHQIPHRTAAQALAIKTVADAKAQRGMFP